MEPLQVLRQGLVRLDHAIGAKRPSVGSEPPKVLRADGRPERISPVQQVYKFDVEILSLDVFSCSARARFFIAFAFCLLA